MKQLSMECCVLGMVSTNCYIVYRKERDEEGENGGLKPGVIIDPGDNAPYILNKCRELDVEPKAVLLTHGHFDHIMAVLPEFGLRVFEYNYPAVPEESIKIS